MADTIRVEVTGTPAGGGGGNQRQPLPPRSNDTNIGGSANGAIGGSKTGTSGDSPAIPAYERIAKDIQNEIHSRGVVMIPGTANYNQIMQAMEQQQKRNAAQSIGDKYDSRRADILQNERLEEQRINEKYESRIAKAIENNQNADPERIRANFDRARQKELDKLSISTAKQLEGVNEEEKGELAKSEDDLKKAIEKLTEEYKRTSPNSYLSGMREKYREAIWKRDNATTEEDVRKYSLEAKKIQADMSRAMGSDSKNPLASVRAGWGVAYGIGKIGMDAYNAYWANENAKTGIIGQMANGDGFGALMSNYQRMRNNYTAIGAGIGGVIGAIGGGIAAGAGTFGIGAGAGAAGGATLGSGIGSWLGGSVFNLLYSSEQAQAKLGSLWADQEKHLNALTSLALVTRNGGDITSQRSMLMNTIGGKRTAGGLDIYDLGYNTSQASQMIANRIKMRGTMGASDSENMFYALNADALEKAYNMSTNSISQLSAYDRYANTGKRNENDAVRDVARFMSTLRGMGVTGMSENGMLRANEFLGYQTQLMEAQKAYMNPNARYAQYQVLRAQRAFGDALDSRAINELTGMNNAIVNPQEGYTKTMTYDVIQSLFPKTRGNLLDIRKMQYSDDPKVREKIQQEMFKRITDVYGDVDTTSGYLALSQYTGIQDPKRLKKWVEEMGKSAPNLTEKDVVAEETSVMSGYTQDITKDLLKLQDKTMREISANVDKLQGTAQLMLDTFKEQLQEILEDLRD